MAAAAVQEKDIPRKFKRNEFDKEFGPLSGEELFKPITKDLKRAPVCELPKREKTGGLMTPWMSSTKLTRLVQSLCQMLKHHHCLIMELMTTSHHHHCHFLIMVMPAERGGNWWWCLNLDPTRPLIFRLLTSSSRKTKTTPVTE